MGFYYALFTENTEKLILINSSFQSENLFDEKLSTEIKLERSFWTFWQYWNETEAVIIHQYGNSMKTLNKKFNNKRKKLFASMKKEVQQYLTLEQQVL